MSFNTWFSFRVTPAEHAGIKAGAEQRGLSVSALVRSNRAPPNALADAGPPPIAEPDGREDVADDRPFDFTPPTNRRARGRVVSSVLSHCA